MGANSLLHEAGGPFLDIMQPLQGEEVGVTGNKGQFQKLHDSGHTSHSFVSLSTARHL